MKHGRGWGWLGTAIVTMPMALAAGCTTTTEEQYGNSQAVMRASPEIRADFVRECSRGKFWSDPDQREGLAVVFRTRPADLERVICRRAAEAIASGRLSYADFLTVERGSPNAKAARVLTGQ